MMVSRINLYLVKDNNKQDFKIGIGGDNRFTDIQRDYDIDWNNSVFYKGIESDVKDLEKILHKTFKKYRLKKIGTGGTEWFKIECYNDVINLIEQYRKEFEYNLNESESCKKIIFEKPKKPKYIKEIEEDLKKDGQKLSDTLYIDYKMDKKDFEILFDFMELNETVTIDLMDETIDSDRIERLLHNCFTFSGDVIGFSRLFSFVATNTYNPGVNGERQTLKSRIVRMKPTEACFENKKQLEEYYNSL